MAVKRGKKAACDTSAQEYRLNDHIFPKEKNLKVKQEWLAASWAGRNQHRATHSAGNTEAQAEKAARGTGDMDGHTHTHQLKVQVVTDGL